MPRVRKNRKKSQHQQPCEGSALEGEIKHMEERLAATQVSFQKPPLAAYMAKKCLDVGDVCGFQTPTFGVPNLVFVRL